MKQTLEEMSTQVLAGILANPFIDEAFEDKTTMVHDVVMAAIVYAKELRAQLEALDNETKDPNEEMILG